MDRTRLGAFILVTICSQYLHGGGKTAIPVLFFFEKMEDWRCCQFGLRF
jgi:hypothetical protein